MNIQKAIGDHDLILMEAAMTEPLRRSKDLRLDPLLENGLLIYEPSGKAALSRLYNDYIHVSRNGGVPIAICTPTWRANRERISKAGVTDDVNADAVAFIHQVRDKWGGWGANILVGGLMGCKNDCYKPEEGLSREAAREFHAWQIKKLADAGVDFLFAATLPALPEAMGLAQAMAQCDTPNILSFVINRDGCILDGHSLEESISAVDAACPRRPLGYMINCSYPSFLNAHQQPASVLSRLIGFQANASSLDHALLEDAEQIQADDLEDWGRRMVALNQTYGLKILGGCCGTGQTHLQYIVAHINGNQTSS